MFLKKSTGELVEYNPDKLAATLHRCGASEQVVEEVMSVIQNHVYEGMYTREIYRLAMKLLRKRDKLTASRFTLKGALMHLGHTGYPFEVFVEKLLQREGYETQRNVFMDGECVDHEIDVVAAKGKEKILVECKHHQREDSMCHIQTALYVYARFLDLQQHFTSVMLVTNTHFSKHVMKYANCRGVQLLGWNYPMNNGLERRIDKYRLYPITLLKMKQAALRRCLDQEIVLLADLCEKTPREVGKLLEVSEKKAGKILTHARALSGASD